MNKFCANLAEYAFQYIDALEQDNVVLAKEYENAITVAFEELADMDAKAWKVAMNYINTNPHIKDKERSAIFGILSDLIKS